MYPYHNRILQRIQNGEMVAYQYVDRYKDITPCLLLHFKTEPFVRPIRSHRFEKYEQLFDEMKLRELKVV